MATAKTILDAPGDYMIYEYLEAIEELKAAYQKALDYATGIEEVYNSPFVLDKNVYDLQGRKVENSKWESANKATTDAAAYFIPKIRITLD